MVTENKRLGLTRFGRQMDARTPSWAVWTPPGLQNLLWESTFPAHRPISEWRVLRPWLRIRAGMCGANAHSTVVAGSRPRSQETERSFILLGGSQCAETTGIIEPWKPW